jgi:hypothetical protein
MTTRRIFQLTGICSRSKRSSSGLIGENTRGAICKRLRRRFFRFEPQASYNKNGCGDTHWPRPTFADGANITESCRPRGCQARRSRVNMAELAGVPSDEHQRAALEKTALASPQDTRPLDCATAACGSEAGSLWRSHARDDIDTSSFFALPSAQNLIHSLQAFMQAIKRFLRLFKLPFDRGQDVVQIVDLPANVKNMPVQS